MYSFKLLNTRCKLQRDTTANDERGVRRGERERASERERGLQSRNSRRESRFLPLHLSLSATPKIKTRYHFKWNSQTSSSHLHCDGRDSRTRTCRSLALKAPLLLQYTSMDEPLAHYKLLKWVHQRKLHRIARKATLLRTTHGERFQSQRKLHRTHQTSRQNTEAHTASLSSWFHSEIFLGIDLSRSISPQRKD